MHTGQLESFLGFHTRQYHPSAIRALTSSKAGLGTGCLAPIDWNEGIRQ